MQPTKRNLLACVTALVAALAAPGASALMIDAFDAGSLFVVGGGGNVEQSVLGSMLGGERDEFVQNIGSGTIQAGASGSSFVYDASNAPGVAGLTWDGVDGSPALDATGLGGIDFTEGGTTTGLLLSFETSSASVPLFLTVFTSSMDFSSITVMSPGGIPSGPPETLFIAFEDFTDSGMGADFSDVGAFTLEIDGTAEPNLQMTLAFVETAPVPEPGTIAQLGLGLMGLSWLRRRGVSLAGA